MSRTSTIIALAVSALLLGACRRAQPACAADAISDLREYSSYPQCAKELWVCRAKCMAGNGLSCIGAAYELEKDSKNADETSRMFRRACLLGVANGCTNYAARIWAGEHSDAELACARRIFEKACAAKEPFACGMVGRLMIENTTPPAFAEGRKYLEQACDRVGGFPCRALAKHLESGKLGDYDPALIRTLLKRACASGDPDACGNPATAAETFH